MQPEKPKKEILIVAIDFPPARTSGIYRPVNMTKYLGRLGYKVSIVSIDRHLSNLRDEGLLEKVGPEVSLHYLGGPILRRQSKSVYAKFFPQGTQEQGRVRLKARTLQLLKKYVLSPLFLLVENFVLFPDEYVHWALRNVWRVRRIIKNQEIPYLLTTSPPRSALVLGYFLKKMTGVKWVVDFRDNWEDQARPRRQMNRWIHRIALRKVVKNADAITIVSPHNRLRLIREFPALADKIYLLTNGYDSEDFAGVQMYRGKAVDKVGIVHAGSLYEGSVDAFLGAVAYLLEREPSLRDKFYIHFIGGESPTALQIVEQMKLADVVTFLPFKEHEQLLNDLAEYSILLLFTGGSEHFNPGTMRGKIYEYAFLPQQVLHVGCDGDAREFLSQVGKEAFAEASDREGIAKLLKRLVLDTLENNKLPDTNREFVKCFDWSSLTGVLSRILEGASPEEVEYFSTSQR